MMRSLINNIDETRRTRIDGRMLQLCEKLTYEESLIVRVSADKNVPKPLVLNQQLIEERMRLKRECEDINDQRGLYYN